MTPTTTARTRIRIRTKTVRRPHRIRRRRLPRLGWWWAGIALAVIAIARTWPWQTATVTVLLAATLIVRAIRPNRLHRIWQSLDRINARRRTLPNRTRTLDDFLRLTPAGFEQAITELALENPHVTHATRVGQANDRGADVLVTLTDGRRILIQCKQYRTGNVGSDTIQTINGVYRDIHHCHTAVIVTTAAFTQAAHATNTLLPTPIRLVDSHNLVAWANGAPAPWQ